MCRLAALCSAPTLCLVQCSVVPGVVLRCAVLRCAVLRCTMLHYAMLHYAALCCTICCTLQGCRVLQGIYDSTRKLPYACSDTPTASACGVWYSTGTLVTTFAGPEYYSRWWFPP